MGFLTPAETKILILTGACLALGGALFILSRGGVELPVARLPEAPLVVSGAGPAGGGDSSALASLSASPETGLGKFDSGRAITPVATKREGSTKTTPGKTPIGPVDLNRATEAQLCTLPGIGPKTAQAILAWRKEHGMFRSVEELDQIKGIGKKKLEKIRAHVRVGAGVGPG